MKKKTMFAFRKEIYLLGKDKDGINYWLEEPSWDCDWYWGFGYVETYTNNKRPDMARDINSHQHFDGLFFRKNKCSFDVFKEFFVETPFSDDEIWVLLDYMKTFYTLRDTSDLFHSGYSCFTSRAKVEEIKECSKDFYDKINKVILPELFKKIKDLLTKEEE